MIKRLAAACVAVLLVLASANPAYADARMSVRLDPATTPVPAGDHLSYNAFIQCSIPGGCENVTVTFTPPPGASGPGVVAKPYPPGITDVTANADGTVTVTYDHVDAGATSQLTVSWPSKDYYTPPGGQTAGMSATASNGDGTPSTDDAEVRVTAEPNPSITKKAPSQAVLGQNFTYELRATNNPSGNTPRGDLALTDVTLTDALPAGVEFVSATPAECVYDAATHTVSMPVDTNPDLPGSQWDQITAYPYEIRCDVTVKVTDPALVGKSFSNTASITGTPYGGGDEVTVSDTKSTTIVDSGSVSGEFSKYTDSAQATDGQTVQFILTGHNTGTVPADLVMVDPMPAGFDPTQLSLYVPGQSGPYQGDATIKVAYADGTTANLPWNKSSVDVRKDGTDVTSLTITVPGLGAGVQINAQLYGVIDGSELPGGAGTVTDCADFTLGTAPDVVTGHECATIEVLPKLAWPLITKKTDPAPVAPGGTHVWKLTVTNDPYQRNTSPLRPEIVDLIPGQLEYTEGSFRLSAGQPSYCPAAGDFDVTTRAGARGRIALVATAKPGKTIPANNSACGYEFDTTVKPGAANGTYTGDPAASDYPGNLVGLFDPDKPLLGGETDAEDWDGDGDVTENFVKAGDDFAIAESAALSVKKEVKGDRDGDWKGSAEQDPAQVGHASAGGTVSYRVTLGNLGNKTLTNVVAYDLLPAPGTKGVTDGRYNDPAVSVWRPTLTGPIDAGTSPVTITYSTKDDPCRPEMDNSGGTAPFYCGGVVDPTFVPAASVGDWASIRSVRFDFGSHRLLGGETYTYEWTMDAPTGEFEGSERTWNKIAIGGRRDDGSPLLATEAPWVVADIKTDRVPPTTPPTTAPTTPPTTAPTSPPTVPPTSPPTVPPTTPTVPPTVPPTLPVTGAGLGAALMIGLTLVIAGLALARLRRSGQEID